MSFLSKLLGRRTPDQREYVLAMAEMAAESDRTYRGMIDTYNSDVAIGLLSVPQEGAGAVPTGRGLYKARLYGALFMVMAYAKAVTPAPDVEEFMNLATGVALDPLQDPAGPHLDREEAKSFTVAYLTAVFRAMGAAFQAGTWLPGDARPEHLALAEYLHEALAESIGAQAYTPEVRERFSTMIEGNTAMAMNHARRWGAS